MYLPDDDEDDDDHSAEIAQKVLATATFNIFPAFSPSAAAVADDDDNVLPRLSKT